MIFNHGGKRQGSGRPKKQEKRVHMTATVLAVTKKEIDRLANISGVSRGVILDFKIRPKRKKIV